MSYRIIKPEENLLDILTEKLLEQGEDMHKCLVIFPGKRPGYFLRKYLAKKTGHSMRSPAIFSMDGFISSFYY
ncbi:MAG: hypothetical protein J5706_07305, partial [Elusimicrobiales bacterium]|nr:hypothetical protein [Elusimicrobiales bacterium]